MLKLVVSVMSWLAEMQSYDKSMAIRRGIAQRKRDIAAGRPVKGQAARRRP